MIKGLHHNAYRCRDCEEMRGSYEDFLGLRFGEIIDPALSKPHEALARWQAMKPGQPAAA